MNQPIMLDLFCGAGGAGEGYRRAGFDVIGVDIEPHVYPPGEFVEGDALAWLRLLAPECNPRNIAAVHTSPPCQRYTTAQRLQANDHPDLIDPVRKLLTATGLPYVIENVPGSPLIDPITLCGAMFDGLKVYRHRLFESNVPLTAPAHPEHIAPLAKMGRPVRAGEFMHVVGNFSDVAAGRIAMGIDWMTRDDLREAIPPAYTEHIGRQLIEHMSAMKAVLVDVTPGLEAR